MSCGQTIKQKRQTLARKMEKDLFELYGTRSGADAGNPHPMSVFDPDDPEGTDFEER